MDKPDRITNIYKRRCIESNVKGCIWMSKKVNENDGTIRIAVLEGPNTLNPLVMNSFWEESIIHLVYDPLGISSPKEPYFPMPWLAESWTWNGNTKTWRVELKKNVTWHDGNRFTANDVKFCYDTIKEFESPKFYGEVFFIDKIEAVNEYAIDFVLSEPRATFINSTLCSIRILPKHLWGPVVEQARRSSNPREALSKYRNESPIGTGSFKYVTYKKDDFVQLEANAQYFGGKPHIKGIQYKIYKTDTKRKYKFQDEYVSKAGAWQALKTGQVDYIAAHICPSMLAEVNQHPETGITPVLHSINGIYYLAFNCRKPPFDDVNFRKAVAYLIDREFFCNNVLLGLGRPIYTLIPEGASYWTSPNAPKYGEGLEREERQERAKEILTRAGYLWKDGTLLTPEKEPLREIKILTPLPEYDARRVAEGSILAYWLRQIGIPATAQPKPPEELRKLEIGYSHDFDMNLSGFWFGLPLEPDYLCGFFHSCQSEEGLNSAGYRSPEFDKIAIQQREEMNLEKRRKLVWEMQDMLARDAPWIALYSTLRIDAYKKDTYEGWVSRPRGFPPYYQIWSYLNIRPVKKKSGA